MLRWYNKAREEPGSAEQSKDHTGRSKSFNTDQIKRKS